MIASVAFAFFLMALLQGAIMVATVFTATRLLRIASPSLRATIWSIAFFVAVILPFSIFLPDTGVEIVLPGNAPGSVIEKEFVTLGAPTTIDTSPASMKEPRRVIGNDDFVAVVLMLFWMVGVLWRTISVTHDVKAIEILRRESTPISSVEFGLPENADVRIHANLNNPLVVGFVRPTIILPEGMLDETGETLCGVLAHERAHVERGDLVANCAETVVLCIFWWNPWLYFIRDAIVENREMACDDQAVIQTDNAGTYALTLVSCAERSMMPGLEASEAAISLSTAGRPSRLARRIARITDCNYVAQTRVSRPRLLLVGAMIAAVTACATAASPRVNIKFDIPLSSYVQAAPRSESERLGRELVEAVIDGDRVRAEQLLANGADIDAVLEGDGTPLIAAINNNVLEFVQWLIANGADVDTYARYDETALISSVRHSDANMMVRLLITAGADVNLSAKTETDEIRSPLGEARRLRRSDIEALLITAGAELRKSGDN